MGGADSGVKKSALQKLKGEVLWPREGRNQSSADVP
jgi:hypothetical protein